MRIRSTGLALFAGLSIFVAACSNGAREHRRRRHPRPASTAALDRASAAPSERRRRARRQSDLKIGVVTDVGTVNDKNFNEYTFVGAQQAPPPSAPIRPPSSSRPRAADYAPLIQAFVDQDYDVIVTVGFNLARRPRPRPRPTRTSGSSASTSAPCINATGDVDPTFADCTGDVATLLPNYIAIKYQEDQAGYLAGIVAGVGQQDRHHRRHRRRHAVRPVHPLHPGLRARRQVGQPGHQGRQVGLRLGQRLPGRFTDQAAGKTFGEQFISQNTGIDVLFQVAGLTGNGVLDAACAAKHQRHRRRRRPARVLPDLGGRAS